MKYIRSIIISLFLSLTLTIIAGETNDYPIPDNFTESLKDSVSIHFRQSKINLDPDYMGNRISLDEACSRIKSYQSNDSTLSLFNVEVIGAASPEGSVRFNEWLSRKRAQRIFDYLSETINLPDSLTSFKFVGRDWQGLLKMVIKDPNVPYREDVISLLHNIVSDTSDGEREASGHLSRLKRLHGGTPYIYMYHNLFPALRASKLVVDFGRPMPTAPTVEAKNDVSLSIRPDTIVIHDTIYVERIEYICPPCKPFYMGLKTNMLYDALAVPNIGVEFYLGKNISLSANWMYGWWKTDRRHRYWRIYGGDITARWWFGRAAHEKPLTGHHLGIYGNVVTYDFELGGTGIMGGVPGGSLWDKCNYGGGIEYGYSLPITRRLNIDFSIALGYIGGTYHKYKPVDNHYVWQSTHKRHYFGPTKAEISLVWLIGCDNYNREKGGKK